MNCLFDPLRVAVTAMVMISPIAGHAQSLSDVLGAVAAVTDWFTKLNAQFDTAVRTEGHAQLQRSVDRLRKNLYRLESDARILMEDIPDTTPSEAERTRLDTLARELQETVRELSTTTRTLGAELRLNEAESVEVALTAGLRSRAGGLAEVRGALLPERGMSWNGAQLRRHMQKGIDDIKAAQLAVTGFGRKLTASR